MATVIWAASARRTAVWAQPARASVYVFVHTEAKSSQLESSLEESFNGLEVTVFGRFRDFEEAMAARPPDAVLGLPPLLALQKIPIALQGIRAGNDVEQYVLVGTAASLAGTLADKTIGSVEILGREGTTELIKTLLKLPDCKLKRVTKLEDLLPLLQLSLADAIVLPAAVSKSVSQQSQMSLLVRDIPGGRLGLPAVGILNPSARGLVLGQFQKLGAATKTLLRVDRWVER